MTQNVHHRQKYRYTIYFVSKENSLTSQAILIFNNRYYEYPYSDFWWTKNGGLFSYPIEIII